MKLIVGLFFCAGLSAQSVITVQSVANAAAAVTTLEATLNGVDGSVCKLAKIASTTVYLYISCTNAKVTQTTVLQVPSATTTFAYPLGFGAVLCLLGVNPTAAAVPMGSIGSAPASGIAWSCTVGDGQTLSSGSATWP